MKRIIDYLTAVLRDIPRFALGLIIGWLQALINLIKRNRRRKEYVTKLLGKETGARCQVVPPHIYRRPDPMIYAQYYLLSMGIAVTWDNPDIQLWRSGVPVSSSQLVPNSNYEIIARIWNNSTNAPAVNLPVTFSYLDFGIGTSPIPIGQTTVNLPVKGAPGHPAMAKMPWHTPTVPGHYCLLVELNWPDDANPHNNLGQENVDIRPLNSPHAQFQFPVRNNAQYTRTMHLEIDAYTIPPLRPCESEPLLDTPAMTEQEIENHWRETIARNNRRNSPVPNDWQIDLSKTTLELGPDEQEVITVDITAPEGFQGRQTINVNAFDGATLVGGVTLHVEG